MINIIKQEITFDESLRRIYFYSKKHFNELKKEETIEECYNHKLKKFSEEGYANFFLEDKEYESHLKELRHLLDNKKEFVARLKKIISEIDNY